MREPAAILDDLQKAVVEQLRSEGFAISIWTPEELGTSTEPEEMEDHLARTGNELIDYNRIGV